MTMDDAERRLLANVAPADWKNPVPKERYDLVVIGAGTGGLVTAAAAAGLGARVAVVESDRMGGDCLNVGCVPSKAVIAAARMWRAARAAHAFGGPAAEGEGDFAAAMARMREVRAELSDVDGVPRFAGLGVDVFLGRGRFVRSEAVEVGGALLRFRRAVIATGARAAAPGVPGLAESGFLTNETVFSLTTLPERFVVIGAGAIGCELAQSFARFGSAVTVLDIASRVLPREDPDAGAVVAEALVRDGVRLELGVHLTGVARVPGGQFVSYTRDGKALAVTGDALLVAAGRAPNVDGLGLEEAGVAFTRTGVVVNDRLQTSNSRIFAVGDVCSRHQFTHSADFQARLVIANALFYGRGKNSALVIPRCTYTNPELAHVGLTAEDAAQQAIALDTVTVPFHDVDRARLDGDDEGFLRIHLRRGTDKIVGATIVGAHAGDLIGEAAVAVTNRMRLGTLGRTIHPYPTRAEAFRKAADVWRRGKLTPTVKRIFASWFRLTR